MQTFFFTDTGMVLSIPEIHSDHILTLVYVIKTCLFIYTFDLSYTLTDIMEQSHLQ